MNLFDRVPPRLFSVLSSPGQRVYSHVLFLLYDLFRRLPFGIPREVVVDETAAYLEGQALAPDALPELAGEVATETGAPVPDARARAQAVLRRLREDGWLELEFRSSYEEFITLADYAIQVLEVLDRVRTQRRAEYAGYVYATYAALAVDDVERQGALALERAYDQTEQLVRELKLLHHNIRRFTEKLLQQSHPREILAMHFLDYKEHVLDRSYHQLRTADHVSRYRPRILARVDQWLQEPNRVEQVAREDARRHGTSLEEAAQLVRDRLHFIQTAYLGMDELLDEIDLRNAQYAKASLEQVRYLLNSSADTEGQLIEILTRAAGHLQAGIWRAEEDLPPFWHRTFRLFPVHTLEPTSLYKPRAGPREHRPASLDADGPTEAERAAARERALARLAARVTAQQVEKWLLDRMGDRTAVRAADLGVADVQDFIRLLYAGALGRSRRVRFAVDYDGEPAEAAGGRYRFKNVTLRRK